MAEHFVYHFEGELPRTDHEQGLIKRFKGKPLVGDVIAEAESAIIDIEAFKVLPERNQKLVLDMASFAMRRANRTNDKWRQNFWGLYIVGSRARGDASPDSDLDLLSAGTFYRDQGFLERWREDIFDGFELELPEELPDEYNVGEIDKKYLVRANSNSEEVVSVDLNVVDLTFWRATLDSFKKTMDVAEDGSQLARVPIFELTVPEEQYEYRYRI